MKGGLFAGVSFLLALYETFTASSPRFGLIVGYMLVFAYGIVTILIRKKHPDYQKADMHGDE